MSDLRKALEEIASQKLCDEMSVEDYKNADFEGGYETCVRRAREAYSGTESTQNRREVMTDLSDPEKDAISKFNIVARNRRAREATRDALLAAIDDWKAPYEVAKIVNFKGHFSTITNALQKLVADGLAEYSESNNTYRALKDPHAKT